MFFTIPAFSSHDLATCLPIGLALISFVIYWFIAHSSRISSIIERSSPKHFQVNRIVFNRLVGFFSMGVIPVLITSLVLGFKQNAFLGLNVVSSKFLFTVFWTISLCIVVIPLAVFSAKKPKNFVNYPQIRTALWTENVFYINMISWALYLFGYELLFRGTLLFPLLPVLGYWPTIVINTALYSATHIPKGMDETLGAIPLGIVLCVLTIESQTIWIAFLVHVAMAWANSLTALKYHPEIHYIKWRK